MPATKTAGLNPEEVAALKEASVSMKPAWQEDPAACPAELMNAFTKANDLVWATPHSTRTGPPHSPPSPCPLYLTRLTRCT